MGIDRIPGVGPQNTDVATAVSNVVGTASNIANATAGVVGTASNIANTTAGVVGTASNIANAVAAVVPSNTNITNIVQTFSGGTGLPNVAVGQLTSPSASFTSTTNNATFGGKNFVYAMLINGGGTGGATGTTPTGDPSYGGPGGGGQGGGSVAFGMVPAHPVVTVAGQGGRSSIGYVAQGVPTMTNSLAPTTLYGTGGPGGPNYQWNGAAGGQGGYGYFTGGAGGGGSYNNYSGSAASGGGGANARFGAQGAPNTGGAGWLAAGSGYNGGAGGGGNGPGAVLVWY